MGRDIKVSAGEWKGGIWTPRRNKMVYVKKKDRVDQLTELVNNYREQAELVDKHTALAKKAKKELLKVLK